MHRRLVRLGLAATLCVSLTPVHAASWSAVIGSGASVVVPGLPAGSRSYSDVWLGDAGAGMIGVRMTSPDAADGYWAYQNGAWAQYMKEGVTGALGPGRSGAESNHVFLDLVAGDGGAGYDGQRTFTAKAGNAGDPNSTTWGVWRWNGSANVEIARMLTDGPLGPGLGANWVYPNSSSLSPRALSGGAAIINADVTSPGGVTNRLLVKSVPGQGNLPCMLRNSTDPALAPGLSPSDYFDTSWSLSSNLAVTPGGRVYGVLSASSGSGIWEVCNGAPRAIAASNRTGALGPEVTETTAIFASSIGLPRPGVEGQVYFFASFRRSTSSAYTTGLFWNDGASNRPLALGDDADSAGPQWAGSTWSSFDTDTLMSAGEWTAFTATVHTSDGGSPSGLWRVQAGQPPELVALFGLTGSYGPEPNRTWSSFYGRAVLSNGDLLVSAYTNPGNEYALWLLQRGQVPRRVLVGGQTISVPTASGVVADTISDFSIDNSGPALYSGGTDSWVGADGSVLVSATTANHGNVRILAIPSNPIDPIFHSGFDG